MSAEPLSASHTGPRDWDAEVYHRVSKPQFEWAEEVIERLALDGDEALLDAGCGTGRVTELLVKRLPRGSVIGVDGSESMIAKAREVLGDSADLRVADLSELELSEPVDVVFSTAVFHWISDHDRLFANLIAALVPGGRLVAQCGGAGNVAALTAAIAEVSGREPFAEHFAGYRGGWNFASAAETEARLGAAGFTEVRCWLENRPVVPDEPLDFLQTVTLGPHLDRLPDEARQPFSEQVAAEMPKPVTLDYVRLNIEAKRPV